MKYYLEDKEVTSEQLEDALSEVHMRDANYDSIRWDIVLCNIAGDKMYFEIYRFEDF